MTNNLLRFTEIDQSYPNKRDPTARKKDFGEIYDDYSFHFSFFVVIICSIYDYVDQIYHLFCCLKLKFSISISLD